jgi:Asp-tRNA(Asn)/Glu-tRNA(Gln) amidotransferase A subunit family amidase
MSRHDDGYQPETDDVSRAKSAYAFASATTLLQALNERRISACEMYRATWRAFLREWDVLLAPVNITPAFRIAPSDGTDSEEISSAQSLPLERRRDKEWVSSIYSTCLQHL